jgi:hypothetical protein
MLRQRFLPSEVRGARRIAPISVLPARTLGSRTAGIGTELLAHREKIQKTRPGSQFERSPVPMDRAIAATHAQFAHFPGEYPKPETGWRSEMDSNSRYRLLNWQTTAFEHSMGTAATTFAAPPRHQPGALDPFFFRKSKVAFLGRFRASRYLPDSNRAQAEWLIRMIDGAEGVSIWTEFREAQQA